MAAIKTIKTSQDVNAFLLSIDDEQKRLDCMQLIDIMKEVTGDNAEMWGPAIVGFGSYSFIDNNGKTGEWFKLGFSPRKKNITIYIMCGMDKNKNLLANLGKHSLGKSCIYIQKTADINMEIMREILANSFQRLMQSNIILH